MTLQAAIDANFGAGAGPHVSLDAGWYNGDPNNAQYALEGSVHLGQFVFETTRASESGAWDFFVFDIEIGYNNDPGSGQTYFDAGRITWGFPAPGALALLGIACPVIRARRA